MPAQSTNREVTSESGPGRTSVSSPGPVSRRRKIAIILVMMLCGYFLIDEREPPAPLQTGSAPISDPAFEELMQEEFELPAPPATVAEHSPTVEQPALQLPQEASTVVEVAHVAHQPEVISAFPEPRRAASTYPTNAPTTQRRPPAPRPRLRFTGEIEPLY